MSESKINSEFHFMNYLRKTILLFIFLIPVLISFSQTIDSTKQIANLSGAITVTNKGISLIPSLTLGKPAAIFDLSMSKGKIRFEPQLRFSMEGKPWSFIFWWRYQFTDNEKFRFHVGAHPAFSFRTKDITASGGASDETIVKRYLAAEMSPSFQLTKNITLNPYLLYANGVEKDLTQNTEYIALRGSISNIKITDEIYAGITPQVYLLKMDKIHGYYVASGFSLAKKNFPFSATALINKTIKSEISGDDLIWNVSLVYSFGKKYAEL